MSEGLTTKSEDIYGDDKPSENIVFVGVLACFFFNCGRFSGDVISRGRDSGMGISIG